jgi:hypothetical protein
LIGSLYAVQQGHRDVADDNIRLQSHGFLKQQLTIEDLPYNLEAMCVLLSSTSGGAIGNEGSAASRLIGP